MSGSGHVADRGERAAPAAAPARWLEAAERLDGWMRERDYAGYDPHDLLSSVWVRASTLGNRWLAVAWTQLGKRSPVQFRPLLGVRPARNAKGIGLVLAAHLRLAEATGEERYRETAEAMVRWLGEHRSTGVRGVGWGYPFPWANRDFFAPAGTPSSVATAFIAHALLDADEILGIESAAELAAGAGEFIRHELRRVPGPDGTFCFSYTPLDSRRVHNANLLAASLLARLAARGGEEGAKLADDVLGAARFSVAAQRPDGAWPYGEGARNAWVDSFHTSYTLVALHEIGGWIGTSEFEPALERGIEYWLEHFFDGPAVGFHPDSPYPIDTHAVAHSILALFELRERIPDALERAERLAEWTLRAMRHEDGSFYYLRGRRDVNRLRYMRWTQAWMLRALSEGCVVKRR